MLDFIVKYWVEVLFGLICGGIGFSIRHHVKLIIEEKKRQNEEMMKNINQQFKDQNEGMQKQMSECYSNLIEVVKESDEKSMEEDKVIHHEIDIIKDGMLSVEGRAFRNECKRLLEDDHIITLNEYLAVVNEHGVYNNLGGNHEGDLLFSAVKAKYEKSLKTASAAEIME